MLWRRVFVMNAQLGNLIAGAQAVSEDALLELLCLCRPQLRRYANRQCASDDVEEAVVRVRSVPGGITESFKGLEISLLCRRSQFMPACRSATVF